MCYQSISSIDFLFTLKCGCHRHLITHRRTVLYKLPLGQLSLIHSTAIINRGKSVEKYFPQLLGRLNYPRLALRQIFPAQDCLSASKQIARKDQGKCAVTMIRGPYWQNRRNKDHFSRNIRLRCGFPFSPGYRVHPCCFPDYSMFSTFFSLTIQISERRTDPATFSLLALIKSYFNIFQSR